MVYLLRGLRAHGLRAAAVCRRGCPAAAQARQAGARVWEIPMHGELYLPGAASLARIARHHRFDILHAHTAKAHSLASIATNLFQGARHLVVHRRIGFRPGRGLLGWPKYHLGVDAYITVSEKLRQIMIDAGIEPQRVHTVRSVTDPTRFTPADPDPRLRSELGIPTDAVVMGNVGYLVPHKDHENLLEAIARVARQVPEVWVVIVGSGPLREDLEDKARQLGIADRLVLTGFREDVERLINLFDIFALSSSEEGICSTLFEVMACEKPIVATDASGVAEAVLDGQTGLLVPIKDPRALADAILHLLRNPDQARRYARAGHRRVLEEFTVEKLTEKTLQVYRQVLAGRSE
jgi:glycosyltransferase involved in cell wall biosynthesis